MLKLFMACFALLSVHMPLAYAQEGQGGPVGAVKVPARGELRKTEVIKAWVAQCQKTPRVCDRDEYEVQGWGKERFELFADDPESFSRMLGVAPYITVVVRQD